MKKRSLHLIAALTVVISSICLLSSCRRTGIDIELFQASMEILTPNIQNGDDFSIKITSSKFPLIITAVQCEFNSNDRQIEPNREYTATSGNELVFVYEKVSIEETHRAYVKLTLKDPSTGKTQEVSAIYSAYKDSDVNVYIDLPPAGGSLFSRSTTPAVIGGEGIPLVIRSKLSSVILTKFDCEFDTEGFLQDGMEIEFDKNGEWRHVFPAMNITEDVYAYNSAVTMSFYSDDVAGDGTITPPPAEYIKLIRPKLEMTFAPKTVNDGGVFGIQLSSSRNIMKLTTVKSSHPAFNTEGEKMIEELFDEEIDASGVTFPEYGTLNLSKSEMTTDKDATYSFSIGFTDIMYTGREVIASGTFDMKAKHAASSIEITHDDVEARFVDDNLVIDIDDFHSGESGALETPSKGVVIISTTDPLSNGEFEYEMVSSVGPGKVKCTKLSTAEDLMSARFEISAVTEGKTAVRFFPKNNRNAAKTLTVYVRKPVALTLEGEFGGEYDSGSSDYISAGWLGVPKKTWATISGYRIKNTSSTTDLSSISPDDMVNNVEMWPINNAGKVKFSLLVKVNNYYTSNLFYGSCNIPGYSRVTILENELWNKKGQKRPETKTLSSETLKTFKFESSSGYATTTELTSYMASFNHYVTTFEYTYKQGSYFWKAIGEEDKVNDELAVPLEWVRAKHDNRNGNLGGITFKVDNIEYNSTEYDLRYVCYIYLVRRYYSMYNRPWWVYPTETMVTTNYDTYNYEFSYKYLAISNWCERVTEN